MEHWSHHVERGYYDAFFGWGDEFADEEGTSAELVVFGARPVVWLEMIKGPGVGRELIDHLKQRARHAGARFILLQVVPVPWSEAGGEKLVAFYRRQGFRTIDLAPWSEFPMMMVDLHRSFAEIT